MAPFHERADRQARLATAGSTGQDAGPCGEAEGGPRRAAIRAGEAGCPAGLFQVSGAGRVVGEKPLEFRQRLREFQFCTLKDIWKHGSGCLVVDEAEGGPRGVCVKRIFMHSNGI